MRSWPGILVLLIKFKSHVGHWHGCFLNERADSDSDSDALAEMGVTSEDEQISHRPSNMGLWSGSASALWRHRVRSEQLHHILHRDTVATPNKSILKQVTAVNLLRALKKRNTQFVRHLLHREESTVLSRVVSRNDDAILRVWYKAMTGIYHPSGIPGLYPWTGSGKLVRTCTYWYIPVHDGTWQFENSTFVLGSMYQYVLVHTWKKERSFLTHPERDKRDKLKLVQLLCIRYDVTKSNFKNVLV
jgi:hypothetical protein